MLLLRTARANKIEVQWEGPGTVLQKLSDTNYVVKLPGRRKEVRIYHCNLMKPYVERVHIVSVLLNEPEEVAVSLPEIPRDLTSFTPEKILATTVQPATLSESQSKDLLTLITGYQDLFSKVPGRTSLMTHDIELTSSDTKRCKAYRYSPRQEKLMKEAVEQMLAPKLIEPGEGDFVSPMIIVEANGKEPRPCVDYRKLNGVTATRVFRIPHVEDCLEKVCQAKVISTVDLVRGHWQVPLTERASNLAAFVTPFGTFRPLVLSFGLKTAPFAFSRLMKEVLAGLESFALPYLDDIAIFSDTWSEHLDHLREVFSRLRQAGLTLKAQKCKFGRSELDYLGHTVGQGHRSPLEVKVLAIKEFPRPETKTQIRTFLGLIGYYQHYIKGFSELASPLTDALKKNAPNRVKWDKEKQASFDALKNTLMRKPVLTSPDHSKPFLVQCDASEKGLGVVLSQESADGGEHPILYVSRKLSAREQAYSTIEKECACLVWAVEKLSCYLSGSPFVFITDHRPLTWLQQMSNKNGRLLRWSLSLQPYVFTVKHKKGSLHTNADSLSRAFSV